VTWERYSDFQYAVAPAAPQGRASVTVDSPEKQRVGIIGFCHGRARPGSRRDTRQETKRAAGPLREGQS
jgi:hypothetical protein